TNLLRKRPLIACFVSRRLYGDQEKFSSRISLWSLHVGCYHPTELGLRITPPKSKSAESVQSVD
ncbi:MAG: hypothetical protein ACE5KJ_07720, partial [Candidatus Zixiibacteriota bacterium]